MAAGGLLPAGEVLEIGQALAVAGHGARGVLDHAGDAADHVPSAVSDLQVLLAVREGDQGEAQPLQTGVEPPLAQQVETAGHGQHGEHGGEQDHLPPPADALLVVLQDTEVVEQGLGGLEAGVVEVAVLGVEACESLLIRHRALELGGDLRLHAQAEPGPGDLAVEEPEHRGGGEQHAAESDDGGAEIHRFFP